MRAVIQRVSRARVTVDGRVTGEIGQGLLVLLAALKGDTEAELEFMARKVSGMRIFTDNDGKMNLDVGAVGGSVLVVSQFTLAAPTASGNRPSFSSAMPPDEAQEMVERFKRRLETDYGLSVASGEFGAKMDVELVNDGPVTIIVDTANKA
ncbi:MAG: D-tyrosyl-tRNA(Tyr) deacylase [Planctomycetales bacterium]|nr:D-tyrosyl-tRNA(Tyr) deacylase [bacterium]UNM07894.1 MAG: D-tyrosyl-tRNA(Tyr) deacylase [Planctomycetales bacterium]